MSDRDGLRRGRAVVCVALLLMSCAAGPSASPDARAPVGSDVVDAARRDARALTDDSAADASLPIDARAPDVSVDASPPTRRALFIGNSYTAAHDLPGLTRDILHASGGPNLEVEVITAGGATLSRHWTSTGARARIEAGDLDIVVLQGQGLEAVLSPGDFEAHGALLGEAVAAAGAEGIWFATWARRAGDPLYGQLELTPRGLSEAIKGGYARVAEPQSDPVARVGAAWIIAGEVMPEVTLHAADGSHPTPAGSLLAGCVIAGVVTGRAPVAPTPPPEGLTQETADALCRLAARFE